MLNKIFLLIIALVISLPVQARQTVQQAQEAATKRAASRKQAYQQSTAAAEKRHPSQTQTAGSAPAAETATEETPEAGMLDLSTPTQDQEPEDQPASTPLKSLSATPTTMEDKTEAAFDQVIAQFTNSADNPTGILDASSNYEVIWTSATEKQVIDSLKNLIKQLNQTVTNLNKNSATKKYLGSGDFSSQNNSRDLRKTLDKIAQFLDNRTQAYTDQKSLNRAQKQLQQTVIALQVTLTELGKSLKYTPNQ